MTSLSSQVEIGNVEILNNRDRFHQDFFQLNGQFYRQRDGVTITHTSLTVMANSFMCHLKEKLVWDDVRCHTFVDSRPNHRNEAAFSNFSGIVRAVPRSLIVHFAGLIHFIHTPTKTVTKMPPKIRLFKC